VELWITDTADYCIKKKRRAISLLQPSFWYGIVLYRSCLQAVHGLVNLNLYPGSMHWFPVHVLVHASVISPWVVRPYRHLVQRDRGRKLCGAEAGWLHSVDAKICRTIRQSICNGKNPNSNAEVMVQKKQRGNTWYFPQKYTTIITCFITYVDRQTATMQRVQQNWTKHLAPAQLWHAGLRTTKHHARIAAIQKPGLPTIQQLN